MKRILLGSSSVFCVLGIFLSQAHAVDIRDGLAQATQQYNAHRDNATTLQQTVTNLRQLVATADVPAQKYDAMLLLSRAIYYQGMQVQGDDQAAADERIRIFLEGKRVAEECITLGQQQLGDQRSECYFLKAINLGRWGTANGIVRSLRERFNLRSACLDTQFVRVNNDSNTVEPQRDSRGNVVVRRSLDNRPGIEYDSYGAYRVLGRMYHQLPTWLPSSLRGDHERAEQLLREAATRAPNHGINIIYFAEILIENGKRDEARAVLDRMLAHENDVEHFNPDRIPETRDEFRQARVLRNSLD